MTRPKRFICLAPPLLRAVLFATSLLTSSHAHAAGQVVVTTLDVSVDTFVSKRGRTPKGDTFFLAVGAKDTALLTFDLSAIPPAAFIREGKLQLFQISSAHAAGGTSITAQEVLAPWDALTATGHDAPPLSTTVAATARVDSYGANSVVDWDISTAPPLSARTQADDRNHPRGHTPRRDMSTSLPFAGSYKAARPDVPGVLRTPDRHRCRRRSRFPARRPRVRTGTRVRRSGSGTRSRQDNRHCRPGTCRRRPAESEYTRSLRGSVCRLRWVPDRRRRKPH
jgi:hypothetical protein